MNERPNNQPGVPQSPTGCPSVQRGLRALVSQLAYDLYRFAGPLLRPKGYQGQLARVLRRRQSLDRRSPQDVWARQKDKLNALLDAATQHVPYYRDLARSGTMPRRIECPEDFQAVPILTKEIIRRQGAALLAENFPRHLLHRNATGGSTGEPMEFWSDDLSVLEGNAGEAWAMSLANLPACASTAYLWGAGRFEKNFRKDLREGLVRLINNCIFIDCFQMTPQDLRKAHERLSRFGPQGLIGYTSALVELATFLRRENLPVSYPRTAVLCAAETLDDVSRRTLQEVFGPAVYNRYGSREIGPVAMECDRHEGLHVDCENIYAEPLDDPAGSGYRRLIVTKLNQFSMPMLRYDTEDLAAGSLTMCSCGRGYPILKHVVGRVTEMIRMPDGTCLPGELFPHLFKDCGIAAFQVLQQADYSLRVSLVASPGQTPQQRQTLEAVVRRHVSAAMPVEFAYVERIERTRTGKLLPVRSLVPRPDATTRADHA